MRHRSDLSKDLNSLTPDKNIPIILVKANICRLLAELLKTAGFNVINNGITIPFPSAGQQGKFRKQIVLVFVGEAKKGSNKTEASLEPL